MGRRIRGDLDGVVQAWEFGSDGQRIGSAYRLAAGADVPDEVQVPAHLLEPDAGAGHVATGGTFDPSQANVVEVNEYLHTASDAEVTRVLGLEQVGHQRKGILEGPFADLAPTVKKPAAKATTKTEGE